MGCTGESGLGRVLISMPVLGALEQCQFRGPKRTSVTPLAMSAKGQKRKSRADEKKAPRGALDAAGSGDQRTMHLVPQTELPQVQYRGLSDGWRSSDSSVSSSSKKSSTSASIASITGSVISFSAKGEQEYAHTEYERISTGGKGVVSPEA